jgi:hypothetical protein
MAVLWDIGGVNNLFFPIGHRVAMEQLCSVTIAFAKIVL